MGSRGRSKQGQKLGVHACSFASKRTLMFEPDVVFANNDYLAALGLAQVAR